MKRNKSTIVFGISSGIAAYKMVDVVHGLLRKGMETFVIMTDHATRMITPAEFVKASRRQVYTDLFPFGFDYKEVLTSEKVDHIVLADSADVFVIAPATANVIAKLAHGIADDLLTTTLLATTAPVLLCPSMNVHMWENDIVQDNLAKLLKRNYILLPPDSGNLACGYTGVGRLADPKKIIKAIRHILHVRNQLKGKKIIVTSGGTSEPIDAVRFITNKASGKMGASLADEAVLRGADVLLLRPRSAVSPKYHMKEAFFETSQDLETLVKAHIRKYDSIFHTAAVSDFLPEKMVRDKIESKKPFNLQLRQSKKILHEMKDWNSGMTVVGFKAVYQETEDKMIRIAKEKLTVSKADYIIANDVGKKGIGFGIDDNEVYIISREKSPKKIPKASKQEIARKILDFIFLSS